MSDAVPGSIIGRFGERCVRELGAGHISDDDELGPASDGGRCLVRPIGTDVDDFGLDRPGMLLFSGPLGTGEGGFILTSDVWTAIDDTIGAGDLVGEPKINAQVQISDRFGCISNLYL